MNSNMFPSFIHLQTQEVWSEAIWDSCSYQLSLCQLFSRKYMHELSFPKNRNKLRWNSSIIKKINPSEVHMFIFFPPNSYHLKAQFTSYITELVLSCKSGVREYTELIISVQNHLSSKRKPQKKRQSFKDNFCEGLRATWTTCDICTNWKSKRGHIGLFFDHLINFPLNVLFILRL